MKWLCVQAYLERIGEEYDPNGSHVALVGCGSRNCVVTITSGAGQELR